MVFTKRIVLGDYSGVLHCLYADYGRGDIGRRNFIERTTPEEIGN